MSGSLSILVPAFNAAPFLEETLRSVLAQEPLDYEVVIVDDASTDRTAEVARDVAGNDPRFRILRNERNLGMTGNWNRCLSEARGDLVLKLDADDVLRPGCLEKLVRCFLDEDVVAAGVRTLECDESGEIIGAFRGDAGMEREGLDPFRDAVRPAREWWNAAIRGHQFWHSSAWMRSTEDLRSEGGYDERFGCAADTEGILRVLEGRGRVAHVASVGVFYRRVSGSVSARFSESGAMSLESLAAYYLSASRMAGRERLSSSVRRERVVRFEAIRRALGENAGPESFAATRRRISAVVASVPPPPVWDRAFWRLFGLASRLAQGR